MSTLHIPSSSLRFCYLGWECVEVNKQEFTELVHLVGNLLRRLIFTMNCLISVETKFMRPCLQLRSNPVLSCHLVDALFNFPGSDIRGKRLEAQLHGLPIHSCGGIKVTTCTATDGLPKCLRHGLGNVARRLVDAGRVGTLQKGKRKSI